MAVNGVRSVWETWLIKSFFISSNSLRRSHMRLKSSDNFLISGGEEMVSISFYLQPEKRVNPPEADKQVTGSTDGCRYWDGSEKGSGVKRAKGAPA
jgi:hypothetical protein